MPEGTAAEVGLFPGTFGAETLPDEYAERRPNGGFEAVAIDQANDTLYAFIQTPLANPDRSTADTSQVIRILAVDTSTGEPVGEYLYLLEDAGIRPGGRVDKIGDAVFDPETGKIFVIERDSSRVRRALRRQGAGARGGRAWRHRRQHLRLRRAGADRRDHGLRRL